VLGAHLLSSGHETAPVGRSRGCEPEARRYVCCEPVVPPVEAVRGLYPYPTKLMTAISRSQVPRNLRHQHHFKLPGAETIVPNLRQYARAPARRRGAWVVPEHQCRTAKLLNWLACVTNEKIADSCWRSAITAASLRSFHHCNTRVMPVPPRGVGGWLSRCLKHSREARRTSVSARRPLLRFTR
jgi:hypothetical protein